MKNKNIKKFSISSSMVVVCLLLIEKLLYGSIDNFECGFAMGMLAMYVIYTIGQYIEIWCKKYLTAIKNAINEVKLEDQIHCLDIGPTPMATEKEETKVSKPIQKTDEEAKVKKIDTDVPIFVVPEETEDSVFDYSTFETKDKDEEFVFDFSTFEKNKEKNATTESKESKNGAIATELGEGLEFNNLDDLLHHISAQ